MEGSVIALHLREKVTNMEQSENLFPPALTLDAQFTGNRGGVPEKPTATIRGGLSEGSSSVRSLGKTRVNRGERNCCVQQYRLY